MATKENLAQDYDYHLSMVEKPLPFGLWKMKFELLNKLQNSEAYLSDRESTSLDRMVGKLCAELGY